MFETIAGITIPDTALVRDATARVRDATDDSLFNHCRRVFLLGSLKAARRGLHVDVELAYVGAMFHDLGLTPSYRTTDRRFELDGAEVAREFLLDHGRSPEEALRVWLAIALHTTPQVPLHLAPEVAVVTLDVETDVLSFDLDEISSEHRNEVIAGLPPPGIQGAHPPRVLRRHGGPTADDVRHDE